MLAALHDDRSMAKGMGSMTTAIAVLICAGFGAANLAFDKPFNYWSSGWWFANAFAIATGPS